MKRYEVYLTRRCVFTRVATSVVEVTADDEEEARALAVEVSGDSDTVWEEGELLTGVYDPGVTADEVVGLDDEEEP